MGQMEKRRGRERIGILFLTVLICITPWKSGVQAASEVESASRTAETVSEVETGSQNLEAASETEVAAKVRVGYYESAGFQEGAGDGELKGGYGYEYMQKIASYTGWHYEYVYGTWEELYEQLVDGEINLMAAVSDTKEHEKEVLFPAAEMLEETFYIYKDTSDESMVCGEMDTYRGKRIGVVSEQKMPERLLKWKEETGAQIEIQEYEDFKVCLDDFHSGKIDGFVSADNVVSGYYGIAPVEKIGKEPYYLCIAKEREDLLLELNEATAIMAEQDKTYLAELKSRYAVDTSVNLFLTKEERAWMAEHDTLTVGYLKQYLPYCDEAKDGSVTGLISELLPDLFSALPGEYQPEITYVGYDSHADMVEDLVAGKLNLIFPIGDDAWFAEQSGFLLTSPVASSTMNLVYAGSYGEDTTYRMAANKNNLLQYNYTRNNFPNAEIVQYDSIEACIRAVKEGEADSTIVNALRTGGLVDSRLKLNIVPLRVRDDRCFGVSEESGGLLKLLNHGISILGENYSLSLAYQYTDGLITYTLADFVRDHMEAVILSFILLFAALLFFGFRRYRRMLLEAEREAEQKRQLEEALIRARQADHAKSVFLHNMSHDIRTPLNGIMGIIDINSRCTDEQMIRENREKARTAATHLLDLVNEVLEMSRLENGDIELNREIFRFSEVMADVRDMMELQASSAGIAFSVYDETEAVKEQRIYGSPLHIREILVNILGNAIKYNRPGGSVSWRTRVFVEEQTVRYWCRVEDTGIGMSKEYLGHIFEPFSQAEKSARTVYQGTGLGMAVVKKLVDKMNGTIVIESEEGVGTRVTVTLPFTPARGGEKEEERPEEKLPDISGLRILVAEDNELNREIAEYLLKEAGAVVRSVKDGSEAVAEFLNAQEYAYDVILMDVMMPVMNGYEATQAIRASKKADAETVPIIAMTANAFAEDWKASIEAGMNEHLTKPLDAKQLFGMIAKAKNGQKGKKDR